MFCDSLRESERPAAANPAAGAPPSPPRTGRVLVLEDDKILGDIMKSILEALGYRAFLTANSSDALQVYTVAKERCEPIDLVIVDLHVPKSLSGKETMVKLLEIDADAKAVVTSGDVADPAMTDFQQFGFKGALRKPFTLEELKRILCAFAPLSK
jgi:CheY-like chemotaxis protein